MPTRDLLVSEIFGPTFQGEGRSVGKQCVFVRLGGCNLHCTWCDTPYTWAFDDRHAEMHHSGIKYDPKTELTRKPAKEIADAIVQISGPARLVVISGGEPMLQQDGIYELVQLLGRYDFEIETAGTIIPNSKLATIDSPATYPQVRYNVSPKLAHSGNELKLRRNFTALEALAQRPSIFKFVVNPDTMEDDIAEIKEIMKEILSPPWDTDRVYIMPLGTTVNEQLDNMRKLADRVLAEGWNLTPRLHTLIWGNERAR